MNCKGPESEGWTPGLKSDEMLPSVVLRSALCQGKLPASWSFTYWFSLAIASSQLTLSSFVFGIIFYEPRCVEEQTPNQTPFWCGCQVVTSTVWQLTDAQRVECSREETCLQIICWFCSCVLGRWALLWEVVQTLAVSVKLFDGSAALEQIWPMYQLCLSALRCDSHLSETGSTSSLSCLPAWYFLLLHAPDIDYFRLH